MRDDLAERHRGLIRTHRFEAHDILFSHRHEYPFAPFHRDFVADFWSPDPFRIVLGFRESGKTTLLEEDLIIAAADGEAQGPDDAFFRNCVIIGAREELAVELLSSVRSEIENNEMVAALYGDIRGRTWGTTKITFRSGRCIQALGRDQNMRGTKHLDWRPDLMIVNDFEDDEEVLSPEGRRRALRRFLKVMIPAMYRGRRKVRIYDTVRDRDSVPMQLGRQGWPQRRIPIAYLDEEGEEQPSWPGHPTMTKEWIENERDFYARLGESDIWAREYMLDPASHGDRTFGAVPEIKEVARTWQAVYAMVDPAKSGRLVDRIHLSGTGWAVWSWVRHELIVWESGRKQLLPSEIVELVYRIGEEWQPVEIGVETTSLEAFLMQPLREEGLKCGRVLPIRGVSAISGTRGAGKDAFIAGLEPFARAGQIVWARDFPELREEMNAFPTGRKDALNALAYALTMKPGRLIYEEWNPNIHIAPASTSRLASSLYLACDSTRANCAAALVAIDDSRTGIIADFVGEGEPAEALLPILRRASLAAGGRNFVLITPQHQWDQWKNVGLVQAARALGVECRPGADAAKGREWIKHNLSVGPLGSGSSFSVSPDARWTLNGFAGGFSVPVRPGSIMAGSEPSPDSPYSLLFGALEAFGGLLSWGLDEDERGPVNWAYDANGRRYRSVLPEGRLNAERTRFTA